MQPDGPINRADVAKLKASHPKIAGVMVETRAFPGFTSAGAFVDYVRFIAQHRARVRRVALVTNSVLAPVAKFMANRIMGVEMRHFPSAQGMAALAWLRSP